MKYSPTTEQFNEMAASQIQEAEELLYLGIKIKLHMQGGKPYLSGAVTKDVDLRKEITFRGKNVKVGNNPFSCYSCINSHSMGAQGTNIEQTFKPEPHQKEILNRIIQDGPAKDMEIFKENEDALNEIVVSLLEGEEQIYDFNANNITVDLSKNGLRRLPEAIFYTTNANNAWKDKFWNKVTNLILSENCLKSLPENLLGYCTGLKGLSLKKNQLTVIPAKISAATGEKYVNDTLADQRQSGNRKAEVEAAKSKPKSRNDIFMEMCAAMQPASPEEQAKNKREAEQRQREAEQRQREAEQRQREAEQRQAQFKLEQEQRQREVAQRQREVAQRQREAEQRQEAYSKQQEAYSKQQEAYSKQQEAYSKQQEAYSKQQEAARQQQQAAQRTTQQVHKPVVQNNDNAQMLSLQQQLAALQQQLAKEQEIGRQLQAGGAPSHTIAFNAATSNQGNNFNSDNQVKSCADQMKELIKHKNITRDQKDLLLAIQFEDDEQLKQDVINNIKNELNVNTKLAYK